MDVAIGEAVFPFGTFKKPNQIGAFCHHLFQHSFEIARQFAECTDHIEQAGVVAERGCPKSYAVVLRMGDNQDFAAVKIGFSGDVVGDAREIRHANTALLLN